jgi:hypothetical protein
MLTQGGDYNFLSLLRTLISMAKRGSRSTSVAM